MKKTFTSIKKCAFTTLTLYTADGSEFERMGTRKLYY